MEHHGNAVETESLRKRLRDEVTCSVCLEYFADPVVLPCEHSFCRSCIDQCWGESGSHALCPMCKQTIRTKKCKPNKHLVSITEIAKQLNKAGGKLGGRDICGKHEERLKLFCKNDKAPICVVCDRSKEHRDHNVVPVEEAAQEYKDQISSSLERLKKQREEVLVYKSAMEKESQDLLKQTETERGKTVDMLKQLTEFIKKKLRLTAIDQVKNEIVKTRDEHVSRLAQELSSLDDIIQEMEERNQQPVTGLLQDVEHTLQRGERGKFENPVVFPLALKWKIWQFHDKNSSLEQIIKQFKDNVASANVQKKANVKFDVDTAHPQLIVSEDHKSLTLADQRPSVPTTFLNSQYWHCVLGCEQFSKSTRYWEVDVRNEGAWAVGVSETYVYLDKNVCPTPKNGVWAIGRWKGLYRAVTSPRYPPLTVSGEPKRIRLCLNTIAQLVTFFDADTAALLYTFSLANSLSDTICPFFWIWEKTSLQICA